MTISKNTPNFLKHSGFPFTTILNKTIEVIKDPATLGIYLYLSSKPSNWEISVANLQNRFGKCRDFIRDRLSELKKLGLMKSIAIKDEKHKIIRWETILYSEPQQVIGENEHEPTLLENQEPGFPRMVVEPPTTNKRIKKIKELKIKDLKPPLPPKGGSERFEEFWETYPVKKAKKTCLEKWMRKDLDKKANEILEKLEVQIQQDGDWVRGYCPNPLTYLNQERWTDEIKKSVIKGNSASDSYYRYAQQSSGGNTYDHDNAF